MNFIPSKDINLLTIGKYCVNASLNIMDMYLYLELEKCGIDYSVEIFAITHKINKIHQGSWIQI